VSPLDSNTKESEEGRGKTLAYMLKRNEEEEEEEEETQPYYSPDQKENGFNTWPFYCQQYISKNMAVIHKLST
jgi:hypothetical protein